MLPNSYLVTYKKTPTLIDNQSVYGKYVVVDP